MLRRFEKALTAISDQIGKTIPWLLLPLAFIMLTLAVLRYGFNTGFVWVQEIPMYLNAIVFMLCIGYTLRRNQHVRVDILYGKLSESQKHWVNLLGSLLLLLPICLVILGWGLGYAFDSWEHLEKSPEPDGLPLVFILKSLIPAMALLLLIQAVAEILRQLRCLFGIR